MPSVGYVVQETASGDLLIVLSLRMIRHMPAWSVYQEEVATFFRSLGLDAATNVRIQGARTHHDIDVQVRSTILGITVQWLVECKLWKTPVTKLHIIAFRQIVTDIGADRGIILSESGFQSGSLEAAQLTNLHLCSFRNLQDSSARDVGMARLRALQERIEMCHSRYWDLSKDDRIRTELRPEVGFPGYSGTQVIGTVESALYAAFRGALPFDNSDTTGDVYSDLRIKAGSPMDLADQLEHLVKGLETRLNAAYKVVSPRKRPKKE